jgi:hypothetical protein
MPVSDNKGVPMRTAVALATVIAAAVAFPSAAHAADDKPDSLFATIAALDAATFDAFNKCSDPSQLQKHADYFAPDVEFYHDKGGVTWNRDAMIANTRNHVCAKFRRELIPGTLKVYPIKDYGAIAQGAHRFCQFDTGSCEGMAEFVVIWAKKDDGWKITRVLSYGHRPTK